MKQVPKTKFQLRGVDMLNLLNLLGKSRSLNTQQGSHFCKKSKITTWYGAGGILAQCSHSCL